MSAADLFSVRVRAMTFEAEGIVGVELIAVAPKTELPAFSAGAHIDLHLANGLVRSYSLVNSPTERYRYQIAVNKDVKSRGGSRFIHETLRPGDVLNISPPRNNFPLDESAALSVFIAGGIGITPMISMIMRCQALGLPWMLFYAARTQQNAAFLSTLETWRRVPNAQVTACFDQEAGAKMLDLNAIVHSLPPHAHVYGCGPLPMLTAFEAAASALPPTQVHREYFAAKEPAATQGGFTVALARSGKSVQVPVGRSILDCLQAIGLDLPYSCREGVCGTCEVGVLEGIPDHRDLVLTAAEQASNQRMMICCSGAKSDLLVLDV